MTFSALPIQVDWDVPIPMSDGVVLRADVFRPSDSSRCGVLLSYGPYAKGRPFQEAHTLEWNKMVSDFPEVTRGSSGQYQNWEVVDPERWVPAGFACVRVDSRGAGRSPGLMNFWSPQETNDLCECIEWAGEQAWSNGRVGLAGISYFAMNQYMAAANQPRHLAAICPWEGASDWYREAYYHGGILSRFPSTWFDRQVASIQHGLEGAIANPHTGEKSTGPEALSSEALASSRVDLPAEVKSHPLIDSWHLERQTDWTRVKVPMLSAANWGGQGLHSRGNFEAFVQAASQYKWLEVHGLSHWDEFYKDRGVEIQRRFFDHFLNGADNGWDRERRVQLLIRRADGSFVERHEDQWPLRRTDWRRFYLNLSARTLETGAPAASASAEFEMLGEGIDLMTQPFAEDTEVTGPISSKLFIGSSTEDADIFLVVSLIDPEGAEVTWQGTLDPNTPMAQGWLRASHRRLDGQRSLPYRPYHTHTALEPLTPGQIYELDVEVWPTCMVVPAGYRIKLTVRGKDYEYAGELSEFARQFHQANRGVGPFQHIDPDDRPEAVFGGTITVYAGPGHESSLLLPFIPEPLPS